MRADPARWGSFVLVAVVSSLFAAWLLNFSRHQWFVTDEFDYFNHGSDSAIVWLLRPHNEHTIVFTKAWFGLLGQLVGLRHYALYMLPLVVSHLVVVAAIYRLGWISTHSRVVASGVALISLAMGAAIGTLTWAGQLQYVGSIAAGFIVLILGLECSGRRYWAIVGGAALFGTLNGSAFIAFGLTAAIVFARRRMWPEAGLVAGIPLAWEAISHFVWAPQDIYAATGLGQILRIGPSFAYTILDTAISQTLGDAHFSSVVLGFLVLGTLALLSVDIRWRLTAVSGRVVAAIAMAAIVTMLSLIAARLSLPQSAWNGGGYSYLVLATLMPVAGILVGHIARSRSALFGLSGVFLVIFLMGAATFSRNADGLQSWKTSGEQLTQAAAAELSAGIPTYADQLPVPDTAPTVSQERLRTLVSSGRLDTTIASSADADQASLNMQWRLVPASQVGGVCQDLSVGEVYSLAGSKSTTLQGLSPGSMIAVSYPRSAASRRFDIPTTPVSLDTLSLQAAVASVASGSVRVCPAAAG